jgi:carboxylate-amine ligase
MGTSLRAPAPQTRGEAIPDSTSVGLTIGLEEEFHVLNPQTGELVHQAQGQLAGVGADPMLVAELLSSTVETATPVCHTLDELRVELGRQRRSLCAAAERLGVIVATAGTVPASGGRAVPVSAGGRYAWMAEEYGQLAAEQAICAIHVHVGVPERELAVILAMRVRRWLPVLLAMSASSPFFRYGDTAYSSYRTLIWSRWPTAGPPPTFSSLDDYDRTIAMLVSTGTITDAGMIYYDVRPSARYPTLEIRVADGCPLIDDAVLIAGLSRALVSTAFQDELAGVPPTDDEPTLLRAASWRAARSGVTGQLVDPVTGVPCPAPEVIDRLLAYVRPMLDDRGEWLIVKELAEANRRRGTSADRQRDIVRRGGTWVDVGRILAVETANID